MDFMGGGARLVFFKRGAGALEGEGRSARG